MTQPGYARLGFVHGKCLGQHGNWESLADALATLRNFLQCALSTHDLEGGYEIRHEIRTAWNDLKTDVDLLRAMVARKGKLP